MSTKFWQFQKNQFSDLKQNLERYVNILLVFGFKTAVMIRIGSVIKKPIDFMYFKFGDVQFLDIMKILGGATTLDSFLKAYIASETKGFSPWLVWQPRQLWFTRTATVWSLFQITQKQQSSRQRLYWLWEAEKEWAWQKQAIKKLQIKTVPPSGLGNHHYLRETWKKIGMTVFKDFCSATITRM